MTTTTTTKTTITTSRPRPKRLSIACVILLCASTLVLLIIACLSMRLFFHAYLVGWLFWLGIVLGALIWLMFHHLTGGHWGWALRRPAEIILTALPWLALGFVPLLLGVHELYPWAQHAAGSIDPILQHQQQWLNTPMILARAAVYFALWIIFSALLLRPAARISHAQTSAAVGLVLMLLTITFASIDWVLAIEAKAFSTIWGLYVGAGFAASALGVLLPLAVWPWRHTPSSSLNADQKELLRDFGNLLLACVVFHAYMSFSQFLVTWSGNTQAEIPWYVTRETGFWGVLAAGLILVYFFLPFGALLFRFIKHHPRWLLGVCAIMCTAQALSLMWMILPGMNPQGQWLEAFCGIAASLFAIAAWGGLIGVLVIRRWQTLTEPDRPRTSLNQTLPSDASKVNQVLS